MADSAREVCGLITERTMWNYVIKATVERKEGLQDRDKAAKEK